MAFRIDNPELLVWHILAASKEVMAVTRVEPHFVVTPKVREPSNDRPALLVDDNGVRVPGRNRRRRLVATKQDLTARPHRHSLRCRTIGDGDNKGIHDLPSLWVDDCHAAFTIRMPSDARDRDVEFPGAGTPLA